MKSSTRMNVKVFAAIVGGSAAVAFGALAVTIAQDSGGQTSADGATVGAVPEPTTTTTAPVFAVQGEAAKPVLTGSVHEQPGENPNRIP
jgi:hypothetical protein